MLGVWNTFNIFLFIFLKFYVNFKTEETEELFCFFWCFFLSFGCCCRGMTDNFLTMFSLSQDCDTDLIIMAVLHYGDTLKYTPPLVILTNF